jgi:hypothetical protein
MPCEEAHDLDILQSSINMRESMQDPKTQAYIFAEAQNVQHQCAKKLVAKLARRKRGKKFIYMLHFRNRVTFAAQLRDYVRQVCML